MMFEERTKRATPIPTVQSQDKGKGKMVEPEPTPKNPLKAQIQRDAKMLKDSAEQEDKDAALIEQMKDIQARMECRMNLLHKDFKQEEREQFTIEEKSRMLVEMIAERKRFFAAQRAEQIRNKPPTRAQLRNKMVTYLRHMDFEVVKDIRKGKAKGSRKKTVARKRTGDDEAVNVESLATKIAIHMLIEKTYPLTQEMLLRMLSRRLEVDHECEMAYELLEFTRSQIKKQIKSDKRSKNDHNRQENGKRQRVKSKSEKSARDHSRISPTQSKKETKKSKTQDKVKGPLLTSLQSLKSSFEVLKYQGPKLPRVENAL
ncbi:hypothetical protein Tco_1555755 [Tanacetum coccineum]